MADLLELMMELLLESMSADSWESLMELKLLLMEAKLVVKSELLMEEKFAAQSEQRMSDH
jgi:hypothetical protein